MQGRMGEIERALPVRLLDQARHHQIVGTQGDELFERHDSAKTLGRAGRRHQPGFVHQGRRQAVRANRVTTVCNQQRRRVPRTRRCDQPIARGIDLCDQFFTPLGMTEQRRELPDLRPPGCQIVDQVDFDDIEAERLQDRLRHHAKARRDQDKIGIERDHRFGLQRHAAKGPRQLGDNRNAGVGRVRRKPDDLFGIGECKHQLVGTDVERHDAMRCLSLGTLTDRGQRREQRDNEADSHGRESHAGIMA